MIPSPTPRSPNPRSPPDLEYVRSKVGFPIRKSSDQSSFAAPQGLSQRTTSFIASQRQGIHRTPLWHLIALMIHTHPIRVGRSERPLTPGTPVPEGRTRRRDEARPDPLEGDHDPGGLRRIHSLHDVKPPARSPRAHPLGYTRREPANSLSGQTRHTRSTPHHAGEHLVEPDGIEPTTSCLQSRRSPN